MNVIRFTTLLILCSLSFTAQSKKIKSCPLPRYKLVWNDEFSSSKLDPDRWVFQEARAGWVNHELQTYVKGESPKGRKVAECKKGTLRIYTFKEDDKVYPMVPGGQPLEAVFDADDLKAREGK